jgi:hypothetical protein
MSRHWTIIKSQKIEPEVIMTALGIPSCSFQTNNNNNNNKRITPVSYLHKYTCPGLLENKIIKYEITTLLTYHKLEFFRKNRWFFEVPEITKTLGTFGQTYPSAGQFSETGIEPR